MVGFVILNNVVIVVEVVIVFKFLFFVWINMLNVVFVWEKFVVLVNVSKFCCFVWVILLILIGISLWWVLKMIKIY